LAFGGPLTMNKSQLEKDISFCIDDCGMNDEQIGDMLRVCEQLGGISCEYFAEEFVFLDDKDSIERYHDNEYLSIAQFNALYWQQP
tara:strand:+ start:185 stop:442 length:258 start_codon:yes stop_codon:yes gene_type:complete